MNRTNIAIMAVAAVAIAACLLATFLMDDDKGGVTFREPVPGDYWTYDVYEEGRDDPVEWFTVTLTGIDGDSMLYRIYDGTDTSYYIGETYDIADEVNDPDEIETALGTVGCTHAVYSEGSEAYENGYREAWFDPHGFSIAYVYVSEGRTFKNIVSDTSTIGEAPVYDSVGTLDRPESGDILIYQAFEVDASGGDTRLPSKGTVAIGVSSVSGETVCYDISGGLGSHTATVDEFIGSITADASEGSGTYALDTTYGTILCTAVDLGGAIAYTDVGSGIVFCYDADDGEGGRTIYRLVDTSMIDVPGGMYYPNLDLWLGMYFVEECRIVTDDGTEAVGAVMHEIDYVNLGDHSYGVETTVLWGDMPATLNGVVRPSEYMYVGVEDIRNDDGVIQTFHFKAREGSDSPVREFWSWPETDLMISYIIESDGVLYEVLTTDTGFDEAPPVYGNRIHIDDEVEVGDRITWNHSILNGDGETTDSWQSVCRVTAVDGENVTYELSDRDETRTETVTVDEWFSLILADTGSLTETVLIDTGYGKMACERQQLYNGDARLVGLNDGVIYGYVHYTDDGGLHRIRLDSTSLASA